MSRVNEINFKAIENALNTMNRKVLGLEERVARAENTITIMRGEMQNGKQLAAHLNGRGMGPTKVD